MGIPNGAGPHSFLSLEEMFQQKAVVIANEFWKIVRANIKDLVGPGVERKGDFTRSLKYWQDAPNLFMVEKVKYLMQSDKKPEQKFMQGLSLIYTVRTGKTMRLFFPHPSADFRALYFPHLEDTSLFGDGEILQAQYAMASMSYEIYTDRRLGQTGVIGQCISEGKSRLIADFSQETARHPKRYDDLSGFLSMLMITSSALRGVAVLCPYSPVRNWFAPRADKVLAEALHPIQALVQIFGEGVQTRQDELEALYDRLIARGLLEFINAAPGLVEEFCKEYRAEHSKAESVVSQFQDFICSRLYASHLELQRRHPGFRRDGHHDKQDMLLGELIGEFMTRYEPYLDKIDHAGISVRIDRRRFDRALPTPVRGVRASLRRILFELIRNAYNAMRDVGPGEVTVVPADDRRRGLAGFKVSNPHPPISLEAYIPIRAGLPVPLLRESQKADRRSSGLGLYYVRRVVEDEMAGRMRVTSFPGEPTEVEVLLPEGESAT